MMTQIRKQSEGVEQRARKIVFQLRNLKTIIGSDFIQPVGKIRVHHLKTNTLATLADVMLRSNRIGIKVDYRTKSRKDDPEMPAGNTCEKLDVELISFNRKKNGNVEVTVELKINSTEEEEELAAEIERIAGIEREPLVDDLANLKI